MKNLLLCIVALLGIMFPGIMTRSQVNAGLADNERVVPVIPSADRNATNRLFLERADKLLKPAANVDYQVLIGNVVFRRGGMFMYCDSAHYDDIAGTMEAFGNVKMEQGDTLFVYADQLEYGKDSTELATLYADPGKKVRLINRDVELRTDIFNYDLGIELGYYEVGGELTDAKNRLTSVYGEYDPNNKDANFRHNVHLSSLSEKDTLNIFTQSLHYNTDSHIADLKDESTIISKDGTIYTYDGTYNTETTVADLYERSLVVTATGKTLTGDTLFYDRKAGYGKAWGNMILNDTVNRMKLLGDYGFYNELTDSAFVTGRALAVDYSSPDSLSLHGDTIRAFRVITVTMVPDEIGDSALIDIDNTFETVLPIDTLEHVQLSDSVPVAIAVDTLQSVRTVDTIQSVLTSDTLQYVLPADSLMAIGGMEAQAADSGMVKLNGVESLTLEETLDEIPDDIPLPNVKMREVIDTTHYVVACPNVRFFRTDLQGVCDSMTFSQKDSLLYLDKDPMVWNTQRQIFGNRIVVHLNDSTADRITLPDRAFMAEMLEEGYYNQLSGREMVAYLKSGMLDHLDVSGNVMLVFYPMEEDSTYNKVANAESSYLAADFKEKTIEKLKMWPQSTEVITPLYLAKRSIFFLQGFRWEEWRRPASHQDLFTVPVNPRNGAQAPENADTGESSVAMPQAVDAVENKEATPIDSKETYTGLTLDDVPVVGNDK